MRLQIVCRETEKEAWEFAHELVGHASEAQKAFVKERFATSEANRRVRELAATGEIIERNLLTGITQVRPGAGIAVVGTPSSAPRRCRTSSISAATPSACRATCTTRKPSASANG